MKRLLSMVLMAALMASLSMPIVAAEKTQEASPQCMYGSIIKAEKGQIEVKEHSSGKTIVLSTPKSTYLLDAVSGQPLKNELKVGDAVAAYYGAVKETLPPKSTAVAIIANIPQDMRFPIYIVAEKVEKTQKGVRITCNNGAMEITFPNELSITAYQTQEAVSLDDITVGSELLVWHDAVAESYPSQTQATKAVALRVNSTTPKKNIVVSSKTGTIAMDGREVPLSGAEIYKKDGKTMLPLRVVAEALGYEVVWNPIADGVALKQAGRTILIYTGKTEYTLNQVKLTLDMAPQQRKDRTYLYADFFEKVLGAGVTVK